MPFVLAASIIVLLILFWLLILVAMLLALFGMLTTRVPFVPVARSVIKVLQKEFPLSSGGVLYDLGSGDGRVVIAMAQAFPEARAVGVEKAPLPYLLSRLKLFFKKRKNAKFLYEDFSNVTLSDATHVYLYLFPDVVQKLIPTFEAELQHGAQVVSCDFPFQDREPARTIAVGRGRNAYTLYVYEF
ncbi:hypothetical protein HY090_01350 [Candidatus Kaiserbacteria bacterium]|nr:hypothetical protein [Candidatus Kaiserbacteria bacterium]